MDGAGGRSVMGRVAGCGRDAGHSMQTAFMTLWTTKRFATGWILHMVLSIGR